MTDVSAGFRPPCWCPSRWAPAWRLHTNLYKFGKKVSPHIFRKKNCCDLNLGESLCISTFFLFPDSRLNQLNGFYFLFWSILNGVTLKTSNWTNDVKNYWTVDRESLGTRLCYISWAEKQRIIKQLLNLAFVVYEEFCRSRRVLLTPAFGICG